MDPVTSCSRTGALLDHSQRPPTHRPARAAAMTLFSNGATRPRAPLQWVRRPCARRRGRRAAAAAAVAGRGRWRGASGSGVGGGAGHAGWPRRAWAGGDRRARPRARAMEDTPRPGAASGRARASRERGRGGRRRPRPAATARPQLGPPRRSQEGEAAHQALHGAVSPTSVLLPRRRWGRVAGRVHAARARSLDGLGEVLDQHERQGRGGGRRTMPVVRSAGRSRATGNDTGSGDADDEGGGYPGLPQVDAGERSAAVPLGPGCARRARDGRAAAA